MRRYTPQPHGSQAQQNRADRVQRGSDPLPIADQRHRLKAESREGRISATDSGHEEQARLRTHKEATLGRGQSCQESDGDRAADVNDHGAEWKHSAAE